MNTPSHPYTKVLDKSLNKIGRAVAGTSIARAVYSHRDIREELLKRLMNDIDNECSTICKYTLPDTGTPSLFRKIDIKDMSIKYTCAHGHVSPSCGYYRYTNQKLHVHKTHVSANAMPHQLSWGKHVCTYEVYTYTWKFTMHPLHRTYYAQGKHNYDNVIIIIILLRMNPCNTYHLDTQ